MRLALAGIFAALLIAAAGLLLYGKAKVPAEMVAAVNSGDAAAFAQRIDFPALRDFLKSDLGANKAAGNVFGGAAGPEAARIGPIVDYFVQPENVPALFYQRELWFKEIPPEAFIDSTGYAPPYGFQVTLGWPKTVKPPDEVPPALLERFKVRIVFHLEGTTWRAAEMHVPLFMVPQQVYGAPAAQLFGRPKSLP